MIACCAWRCWAGAMQYLPDPGFPGREIDIQLHRSKWIGSDFNGETALRLPPIFVGHHFSKPHSS